MSINVKGENCKLWINERNGKNGKFKSYSIGVSRKDMNTGEWIRGYQDVTFTKNVDVNGIENGTTFDFEGWMSTRTAKDSEGKSYQKPVIMINKASFQGARSGHSSDRGCLSKVQTTLWASICFASSTAVRMSF